MRSSKKSLLLCLLLAACARSKGSESPAPGGTTGGASAGSSGASSGGAVGSSSSGAPASSAGTAGSSSSAQAGTSAVGGAAGSFSKASSGQAGSSGGDGGKAGSSGTGNGGTSATGSTGTTSSGGSTQTGDGGVSTLACIGPAVSEDPGRRRAAARPEPAGSCTDENWVLSNGVCCPTYCSDDPKSEHCDNCKGTDKCVTVNSKACTSGEWPEVRCVSDDEPWHYSRSTHFGLTSGGACAFGLYGLCTKSFKFTDPNLATQCDTFCKAWPDLCRDPENITLRGNFAAPPGHYYTQFWPSLPGDNDNYLSCGECFELVRTKKDGSDYPKGEAGYTPSVVLQIVDSCPCSANSKWCCGSGRDHCAEVSDYKYGCQLPPTPTPPVDRDPLPSESLHLDLSDIAMARLQNGDANKEIIDGVIPTRYRRVPCPVKGNIHILLKNGGEYYFSFSVVNMAGLGSLANVEARLPSGEWVSLIRDPNYKSYQPQERFGTWVLPQGKGPFTLPLALRFTDPAGKQVVSEQAVKDWNPPTSSDANLAKLLKDFYYIDTGVQF